MMTALTSAGAGMAGGGEPAAEAYVPGVCNIGPDEIARRRRGAIVATVLTVAVYAILLAVGVDRPIRLIVGLPAAAATVSWLQVRLRFCVAFASRGIHNFGSLADAAIQVLDPAARRADRQRTASMLAAALAVGIATGIGAALIP